MKNASPTSPGPVFPLTSFWNKVCAHRVASAVPNIVEEGGGMENKENSFHFPGKKHYRYLRLSRAHDFFSTHNLCQNS